MKSMAEAYYVAPDGLDSSPGSVDRPFKTIVRAQAQVRQSAGLRKHPIRVCLREGTHYLENALVFSSADAGAPEAPVTWAAYQGERVVISGGVRLALSWEPYRDGILQAKTPDGLAFDQLFVNGKRQHMARYPNFDPAVLPYNGFAADAFSPERAARWADPASGYPRHA